MFDKIIAYSIHNKFIIGILVIGLIAVGSYSIKNLPIDALPDITNNQVQIITTTPSLATQEVELYLTYPIELAVKSIPEIVELRSVSRFGLSLVTVVFEESTDIYWARNQITERLQVARAEIPESYGTPTLAPISTGLGEVFQYTVNADSGYHDQYNTMDLRSIQDWIIVPQLLGTKGIAEVNTLGGILKEYEVAVNPNKLNSMGITMIEIFDALTRNNENTGGAYIDKKPYAYYIRGVGMANSLDDISKIVVKNVNGIPILIRDIAAVQFGHAMRYGATTKDGKGEVVNGMVMMLKGANSAQVVQRVKDKLEQIKTSLPEGVVITPYLDRSKLINRAISTVKTNLLEGALIVVFILVLLIGNWRAGLIVASVIPLALLFAVSMMRWFGVSGNLMSLGAIDFGLIVDGAVIIVEAIVHRLQLRKSSDILTSAQMDQEVYQAASGIRKSAAFGEIIILIVYLPILALVGIEGKMFVPMAQTVSFAILGAFILSLTYVPMMSALLLSKKANYEPNISDRIIGFFLWMYTPILNLVMRIKIIAILIAIGIFIFSITLFNKMGGEFIPNLEEGDIATHIIIPSGSSLDQEIATTTKAEKLLLDNFPEIEQVVSKIGSAEVPTDPMPMEVADMLIILKDKSEWTSGSSKEELFEKMENVLDDLPGVTTEFSQPVQMRFNELMTGIRSDVGIQIFGEDVETLVALGDQVVELIHGISGVENARAEAVSGLPQINITYDKDKIALYGLDIKTLNQIVQMGFAGSTAGNIYEGEKKYNLVVRLQNDFRNDVAHIRNLYVPLPSGNQIPLDQVADIEYKLGPAQISRSNGKRRIIIGFNVRGRDVETVVSEIQSKINASVSLPTGYYVRYAGQFENLKRAKQRLSVAVPIALSLIFVLLYFTFKSVVQSLLIFTAIPLSAIGGIFALWIRGMPFSISAGIGFIALFGVAVLNGIVLIGCFNQLKKEGVHNIIERIKTGTAVRLRPVIMTASVASMGFLPMALSTSAGAEVQKPLATVVIGGLVSATFLTLLILPILYYYSEKTNTIKMKSNKALIIITLFAVFQIACTHSHEDGGHTHGAPVTESPNVMTSSNGNKLVHLNQAQYLNAEIDTGWFIKKNLNDVINANGYTKLDPEDEAEISMPLPGIIESIKVIEGQKVRKGELLATMSSLDYNKFLLDRAKFIEELESSKAQTVFLQQEYDRHLQLAAEDIVSQQSLQEAKSKLETELANQRNMDKQIQLINQTIGTIRMTNNNLIAISAPISGFVTHVGIRIGSAVNPLMPIFELVNTSDMHVDLLVYEKDLQKIKAGQNVRFILTNQDNQEIKGKIYNIGKSFASDTKSVAVHADITDHNANLIPGMYINALIDIGNNVVDALPKDAVVKAEGREFIYILHAPNSAQTDTTEKIKFEFERIEVKTSADQLGFVEVTPLFDIPIGSKVVKQGSYYLQSHLQKSESGGGHSH